MALPLSINKEHFTCEKMIQTNHTKRSLSSTWMLLMNRLDGSFTNTLFFRRNSSSTIVELVPSFVFTFGIAKALNSPMLLPGTLKQSIAHTHTHTHTVGTELAALRGHPLQAQLAHHRRVAAHAQWLCPSLCTYTIRQSCAKFCVGLCTCRQLGPWSAGTIWLDRLVAYASFMAKRERCIFRSTRTVAVVCFCPGVSTSWPQ